MKLTTKQITAAVVLVALAMPVLAMAQILPATAPGGLPTTVFGTSDRVSTILLRIVEIALSLAGLIAILFLIIGGFRYVTAAGNEEAAESAKKTILNAIIGIIVIILSFVILRVIDNALRGST
jgi:amino acid transporter